MFASRLGSTSTSIQWRHNGPWKALMWVSLLLFLFFKFRILLNEKYIWYTFFFQCGFELYDHNSDPHENINLAMMNKDPQTIRRINDHFMMLKAGWRATYWNITNHPPTFGVPSVAPTAIPKTLSAKKIQDLHRIDQRKPLIRSTQKSSYNENATYYFFDASFVIYFFVLTSFFVILWALRRQ
jgi:hypothetical protein